MTAPVSSVIYPQPSAGDIARLPLPPGSFGLPLLGETLEYLRSPPEFIGRRYRRHGNVFRTHLLGAPMVFLIGSDALRFSFAGENKYLQQRWPYSMRRLFGAEGTNLLVGEVHKERRRVLGPHFAFNAMRGFVPTMEAIAKKHLARWSEQSGVLTIVPAVRAMILEILSTLILSDEPVDQARLGRLCHDWFAGLVVPIPLDLPGTAFGRALAAKREIGALLGAVVDRRMKLATQPDDVLAGMLSVRDDANRPLSRQAIVDEIMNLMIAGQDTTISATGNLLLLLAQHPDVLRRCREEQDGIAIEGGLTLDHLKSMPYLNQTVQEAMRFITPVANATRATTQDVACAGYRIPKDWTVALCLAGTHHASTPWTDPERFDPDRFGPERAEHKREACPYVPFGGGPRVCLGQHLAMVEMSVIVALMLRGYRWELLPDQDLRMNHIPVPSPKSGIKVRFSRR
ncbi:cytochrome P450 [Minicystis rosea]|nr:cytochrome P450 [Minicystis rosea]